MMRVLHVQAQARGAPAHASHQASRQRPSLAPSRRQLLSAVPAAGLLALVAGRSQAVGLESIDLPSVGLPGPAAQALEELRSSNQATLDAAEEAFQNSELLRSLKERTEANKDKRKQELADLYCRRQAELGVGDCGGLRYIPGMTKSGVQKRPEWLDKLLGLEGEAQ